jgi:ribonuclease BN (tRNA processing enzyme)
MDVTPLGTSACVANPGNACSGHLLRDGETTLLLDCGPGVIGNLRRHIPDFRRVSGILITHMHKDHFLDLLPLRCGLKYLPPVAGGPLVRIPLCLPPGGKALLVRLQQTLLDHNAMAAFDAGPGGAEGSWDEVFDIREFEPGQAFTFSGLGVRTEPVVHDIPAWAVAVDGSRRFAYSGDSGPCPGVVDIARDADLFLCEAGSPEDPEVGLLPGTRAHLSASEAGEIAREANAEKLLLTHLWWEYDSTARVEAARAAFGRDVELAEVNKSYEI